MPTGDAPGQLLAIGVDGAPAGWAAACLYADATDPDEATTWETRVELFDNVERLAALHEAAGGDAAVAIDIPIGLPSSVDHRRCDREARALLTARYKSVFAPPARYMLAVADDYGAICDLVNAERETNPKAKGLSPWAAPLVPKIAEVDTWVRAHRDSERWLYECHPELSFHALNDGAPLDDKHRPAGVMQRLRLVRGLFPDAEDRIEEAPWSGKQVGISDLLDAYAALSTALVCTRHDQEELGGDERDGEGVLMRMAL